MSHDLWAHVVHSFLFVVMACMAYLLVSPKHKFHPKKQLITYICVSSLIVVAYLAVERPDPAVFALYMTPICLALAILYYRWTASSVCIVIMTGASIFLLGNAWEPVVASTTVLVGLGIVAVTKLPINSLFRMSSFTLIGTSLYLGTYLGVDWRISDTLSASPEELLLFIPAALVSAWMVAFLSFFVKNQIHLQKELNLSEKYQTIGQLAASISHEIRNPLTTTRGFLQLMNYDKLTKENFERYRKFAFEGLDHANSIITDYLNFSKPNNEIPKQLNVAAEIEGVVKWLQPYAVQSNVSIVTHHMSEDPLYISAEPKQFQQCMLNIMKNAIESMTESGGLLTVHSRSVGEHAQILIRDTGVGMDQDQLKQIGMPYFSTKESGTGLGLMVVMSLVKAMNGKIMFRSKPNQGTICEIHLNRYRSTI
ncbi:ATP-binding protein [Paenibacillus sp. LHD-117]|uniref:ATP-binding protein n=1 Tax=Paenibacillus sp. LHD-117 TaxID=3071412 RepID=UPI0027DF7521|nr:ATP-binding protein [Paenibacillus sp. LHD-117]MDQ6419965.1 ATP-binding protein [Paenibacillus sp. LHD-117]